MLSSDISLINNCFHQRLLKRQINKENIMLQSKTAEAVISKLCESNAKNAGY